MVSDLFLSSSPNGLTHKEILQQLCEEGVVRRYGNQSAAADVRERLGFELELIGRTGFTKHYLFMWDIVDYAKQMGIPVGPGRDWQPCSLVAHVLGITDIDPLRHGLIFEMWLNPERVTPPCLEVDIAYNRCDELMEYVRRKHGEYVVPLIYDESYSRMVQDERLDLMKLGRIAMLWRLVLDLHPQKNLAVNQTVLKLIREAKCVDLNLNDLSIDDPETYEMLSRGQICGVFQVDSLQAANACRRIKPSRIQDIAALVAFNELGLEDSIALYAARKLGEVPVTYKHELLEPILRDTYGMIVYREQYVQAIELLAGYTRARADLFRRDNRKDDPLLMNLHRHSFVNGCSTKSNIPKNMAKLIIDDFNKASSHCFPKSYAVSVSIVAYQTAYLKAHYPFEFYSGLLEHHCDDPAYVLRIRDEMNSCGTGRTPFFGPEGELVSGVLLMV